MTANSIHIVSGIPFAGVTFNASTSTFTLAGSNNYTNIFQAGFIVTVTGTGTSNDGYYSIVSSAYTSSQTVVTVQSYSVNTAYPGTVPFVSSGTGRVIWFNTTSAGWTEVDGGFDTGTTGFVMLAQTSANNAAVVDAVNSNVGVTTNGGTSWTLHTTPAAFTDVVASGSNYVGFTQFPFDAYYSSNGTTWTAVGNAPTDTSVTAAIYDFTSQTLLFIIDNGDLTVSIWRLPAGATSFTQTVTSSSGPNGYAGNPIRTFQTNGIWLAPYINYGAPAPGAYTYQSSDNGVTWTAVSGIPTGYATGPYAWNGSVYCIAAYDGNAAYVNPFIYTSPDLSTWTKRATNLFGNGTITTVDPTTLVGGSGYDSGGSNTYNNVPLTGGTGTGATAQIIVTSGSVTLVGIIKGGTGYSIGDTLSASNTNLGGTGSGFSINVAQTDSFFQTGLIAIGSNFVSFESLGVCTSTNNGVTWTTYNLPTGLSFLNSVYVNGSACYAIGDGIASSTDGISWTNQLTSSDYIVGFNFSSFAYSLYPYDGNSGGSGYVDNAYTIGGSVAGSGGTFTLSGGSDLTSLFTPTTTFFVVGSLSFGNDGTYVVASSSYTGGQTVITVTGSVPTGGETFGYASVSPYTNVPLTGGHGSGAKMTAYVSNANSSVNYATMVTNQGTGYLSGDILSASNTNLGGTGSGFEMNVSNAIQLFDIGNYSSTFLAVGQQPTTSGTYDGENGIWRHS